MKEKVHRLTNENLDLFLKIIKLQKEQLKKLPITLSRKQPSLSKALGYMLVDRYGVSKDPKKIAEDVSNEIMDSTFLNRECNSFLKKQSITNQ